MQKTTVEEGGYSKRSRDIDTVNRRKKTPRTPSCSNSCSVISSCQFCVCATHVCCAVLYCQSCPVCLSPSRVSARYMSNRRKSSCMQVFNSCNHRLKIGSGPQGMCAAVHVQCKECFIRRVKFISHRIFKSHHIASIAFRIRRRPQAIQMARRQSWCSFSPLQPSNSMQEQSLALVAHLQCLGSQ